MDQDRRKAIQIFLFGSVGLLAAATGMYALSKPRSPLNSVSETTLPSSLSTSSATSEMLAQPLSTEVSVRVVYFGMPLAVTGVKKEMVQLESPAFLSGLKSALAELHPDLKSMLPSMLFLVDGVSATGNVQLENNVEVDVLSLSTGG